MKQNSHVGIYFWPGGWIFTVGLLWAIFGSCPPVLDILTLIVYWPIVLGYIIGLKFVMGV